MDEQTEGFEKDEGTSVSIISDHCKPQMSPMR